MRNVIVRIESGEKPTIARLARSEVERLFSIERLVDGVTASLEAAVSDGPAR